MKIKKSTIITLVLLVLVLVSVVQAFQLNGLKAKISEGKLSRGSSASSAPLSSPGGAGAAAPLPTSIQNLPTMVGGC